MSRVFFHEELEGVATFWRIMRGDGVALGFTSHDRDLRFAGLLHRAAPGMLPSAIRRTATLEPDSAEVQGALSHDAIAALDLAAGRFDGAGVAMGLVDWETLEHEVLYRGEIGSVAEDAGGFEAELRSLKAVLEQDDVPRTSPTCRARFCGPGCTLSASRFTHEAVVAAVDLAANSVVFAGAPAASAMRDGSVRWVDGPQVGLVMQVVDQEGEALVLDAGVDTAITPGMRALLREGCDHTLETCRARFGNVVNFQGEPHLPGNDVIARYPTGST